MKREFTILKSTIKDYDARCIDVFIFFVIDLFITVCVFLIVTDSCISNPTHRITYRL